MTWILPKQLHTLASALDTEALSLDSSEQSQIFAQSLMLRSKPSPLRTWSQKWKRDSWMRHLFGRTLKPSLGSHFATEWISSVAAIRASHSVQPASDSEVKTPGISGRISQEAFQFFNQESASLKTSRATLPVGCITFCATWEDWVTEQRGAYSQRLNAVRHTNASGCLSWPSPVASEVRQGFQDRSRGMKGSQESLTTVVIKSWPTPNAADSLQGGTTQGNRKDPNLSIAVHGPAVPASSSTDGSRRELWQTATVSTGAHRQKDGSMIDKLDQQVKNWATPDASDRRSDKSRQVGLSNQMKSETWPTPSADGDSRPGANADPVKWQQIADAKKAQGINKQLFLTTKVAMESSGKLNPRWVETLMGLPVGWTMPSCASPVTIERMSSDSSATVLSRQQQNEPSEH